MKLDIYINVRINCENAALIPIQKPGKNHNHAFFDYLTCKISSQNAQPGADAEFPYPLGNGITEESN